MYSVDLCTCHNFIVYKLFILKISLAALKMCIRVCAHWILNIEKKSAKDWEKRFRLLHAMTWALFSTSWIRDQNQKIVKINIHDWFRIMWGRVEFILFIYFRKGHKQSLILNKVVNFVHNLWSSGNKVYKNINAKGESHWFVTVQWKFMLQFHVMSA